MSINLYSSDSREVWRKYLVLAFNCKKVREISHIWGFWFTTRVVSHSSTHVLCLLVEFASNYQGKWQGKLKSIDKRHDVGWSIVRSCKRCRPVPRLTYWKSMSWTLDKASSSLSFSLSLLLWLFLSSHGWSHFILL